MKTTPRVAEYRMGVSTSFLGCAPLEVHHPLPPVSSPHPRPGATLLRARFAERRLQNCLGSWGWGSGILSGWFFFRMMSSGLFFPNTSSYLA